MSNAPTFESNPSHRKEDAWLLQGRGRFVDNVHLDRMAHGAFVRSPMAHAKIVSIDASEALAAGALCVLTARDLPFAVTPWVLRHTHPSIAGGMPRFLAIDRVRYVGEAVAFVVAPDRYRAEDLAALVKIEYDALPVAANVAAALAPGAPQIHEAWPGNVAAKFQQKRGDAASAMAKAVHRVKQTFNFARQIPLPLETRGIVADFDSARQSLNVWISSQALYNVRQNLSVMLDMPEHLIRVVAEDVGGGFGSKSRTYPEEIIVSHASRLLGRPVKWIEDRFENLQGTTHSRGVETEIELGCDAQGRIVAMQASVTTDIGANVFTSGIITSEMASANLPNAYRVPEFEIDVRCIGTNRTPLATYRGAGQPEATFPMECTLDLLAKKAGLSPADIRRRNLVRPADLPYAIGTKVIGMPVGFESGDFPSMLEMTVNGTGYSEDVTVLPDGQREAWGLSCGIEGGGFSNYETAHIRIDTRGKVTVFTGMSSQGQGQATTLAQVCAETLGVAFDDVTVRLGDTGLLSFGRGAFASRGAIYGGNAVFGAAKLLLEKAVAAAAKLLKCEATDVEIVGGSAHKKGSKESLVLGDVARAVGPGGSLFTGDAALTADFVYNATQLSTYSMSVHAVKVRVNPKTGFFSLLDYLVVHDAGRTMNRTIVDGQVVGGVADGIGGAMLSEMVYDENGQILTGTLADYLVATAPELPRIRVLHHDRPSGTNPLGVRGIGEGGTIAASSAIANALSRAIDAKNTGHEAPLHDLPLRPERVFEACRRAAKSAQSTNPKT